MQASSSLQVSYYSSSIGLPAQSISTCAISEHALTAQPAQLENEKSAQRLQSHGRADSVMRVGVI